MLGKANLRLSVLLLREFKDLFNTIVNSGFRVKFTMIWLAKSKIECIAVWKASSNFLQASVESLVRSVPAWINSSWRDYTGYWAHHWREEKYFTKQE